MLKCTRTMVNTWFKYGQSRTQLTKQYSLFYKEPRSNPAGKFQLFLYLLVHFENWVENDDVKITFSMSWIFAPIFYVSWAKSYFRNICWNLKLRSYYATQILLQNSNYKLDRSGWGRFRTIRSHNMRLISENSAFQMNLDWNESSFE